MGANASGKTSLGRVMCAINNYLTGESIDNIAEIICDKNSVADFEAIYATPETKKIHKLNVVVDKEGVVYEEYKSCKLKKTQSLKNTLKEVDVAEPEFTYNRDDNIYDIKNPGFKSVAHSLGYDLYGENFAWNYMFSEFNDSTKLTAGIDTKLLTKILKSFDSSIKSVKKIKESNKDSYIIKFANGDDVIAEDKKILNHKRLSRGTLEAIDVASFIYFLMNSRGTTLFLDEKMAYSHSEIEIAMLNLMIEKLGKNSQLFYTSHNYDILQMNLPTHSYIFMRKDKFVQISHPEKLGYTKNDRSLLGYVKNDVFNTLPDTTKIEELL